MALFVWRSYTPHVSALGVYDGQATYPSIFIRNCYMLCCNHYFSIRARHADRCANQSLARSMFSSHVSQLTSSYVHSNCRFIFQIIAISCHVQSFIGVCSTKYLYQLSIKNYCLSYYELYQIVVLLCLSLYACAYRIEGAGNFTDSSGQVWCGVFLDKKAPGLRFRLDMW